jgi:endogenous inhibitor of DNA gyrase (YacG/DUF329 family)
MRCPICHKLVETPRAGGSAALASGAGESGAGESGDGKSGAGESSTADPKGHGGAAFPFCSERCKLIDLGRWLDGAYQVPVEQPGELDGEQPDEDPR